MNTKYLHTRIPAYFIGLLIVTVGIAFSVKSDLGVSPVSSIPYTMTCVAGIEMGKATIMFHTALVFLQIILLRRRFKLINFLQVPVGIVFGYFTTFCNWGVSFLPDTHNLILRLLMLLISCALIALGLFFYFPANIMPLAAEGMMGTVTTLTGLEFAKSKIAFDVSTVVISLVVCLIFLHRPGSIGIGTAVAAVLVGNILIVYNRHFGRWRDRLLGIEPLI